eukprot:COSAG02_NODE_381_length_23450_cov_65.782493_10_plen_73_part_00
MLEFVQLPQSNESESRRHHQQQQHCGQEQATCRETAGSRATTAALMPTLRALDETGAKIECFLPPRVHIDGW